MEISLHMSISLSSRFPSPLPSQIQTQQQQQQQNPPPPLLLHKPNHKISTGDLHRPSAIKWSGLHSAIHHAIEEEEEYRKARAEVNRKGIDARGYVIEGFSVGGHETYVIIPTLNSVFDIGRCPTRTVHQDFLFITQPMPLQYHNSPLLSGTISLNLIWYGSFKPSQQAIVIDFHGCKGGKVRVHLSW